MTLSALEVDHTEMANDEPGKLDMLLDQVEDEATFLVFLNALSEDWEDEQRKEESDPSPPYGPGANGWENGTIGAFLDAAHAWGEAWLDREDENQTAKNAWHRFAQILYAGKYYE